MKITLSEKKLSQIKADYELIFIVDKNLNNEFIKDQNEFSFYDYKGSGVLSLNEQRRVYVGIKDLSLSSLRDGIASGLRAISAFKISSVKMASYFRDDADKMSFLALSEGAILGLYSYQKYKSEKKEQNIKELIISTQSYTKQKLKNKKALLGLEYGTIIAQATNIARDMVNETPQNYTPKRMAKDAIDLSEQIPSIKCEILDEKELQKQKMGALLAVGQASPNPPRLIHLSYKGASNALKIVIVGKGVTYDTGGLSLKPSDYMLTMKADKSGAIAALNAIRAAALLKLPFEIHAVLGAVENAIGSKAYKPDDVLISHSKLSIEIKNTDAEGRLVLADALSWAQENIKPDLIIDIATLTGACVVGLGEYTSGILGNNYDLQSEFYKLSKASGEFFSILEFNEHLRELLKSDIADISNAANTRYGGSLTAGLFLDKFIKDEYKDRWLHLDIAGPAYVNKAWGVNPSGASGAGVRALVHYFLGLDNLMQDGKDIVISPLKQKIAKKSPNKKAIK